MRVGQNARGTDHEVDMNLLLSSQRVTICDENAHECAHAACEKDALPAQNADL